MKQRRKLRRMEIWTVGSLAMVLALLSPAPASEPMYPAIMQSMMSVPMMPTTMACQAPNMQIHPTDPLSARPMGVTVAGGMLSMMLGFDQFAGPVDIYLMAQMPGGQQLFLDAMGQWMPQPPNLVAWRAGSAQGVNAQVFQMVMGPGVMPGMYYAYVVVVPAGMNPAMFDLASSPYYLWCFNQMLP